MRDTRYAVGIPTRGRTDRLIETIEALFAQTLIPRLIVVVNNNEPGGEINLPDLLSSVNVPSDISLVHLYGNLAKPSDAMGSQLALEFFNDYDYRYAVKWDDDLVPASDCMEQLADGIRLGYLAVGGMYPSGTPLDPPRYTTITPEGKVVSGNPRIYSHLQLYPWNPDIGCYYIEASALYSSFMYDVHTANLVGGFAGKEYTQHSYKHETDFTLRLARVGKLAINTAAKAIHKQAEGGVRAFSEEEGMYMCKKDTQTFYNRMQRFGISPEAWRTERGQVISI